MKTAVCTSLILLGLTACATHPSEPKLVRHDVNVPIATSCVPADPQLEAPAFADNDAAILAAPDASFRYQLFAAAHALHESWEKRAWIIIQGCKGG